MIEKKGNNDGERAAQEYVDTTLRTSHYKQSEETQKMTRLTLRWIKYCALMIITWFSSVQYDRHYGSVINDGLSRNSIELENFALDKERVALEHVWKIVDDQKIQILHLMQKMHFKEETNKIFLGFLTNETRYLNHALVINPDRANGFPFREWNPALVEPLLQFAFDAFHYETLFWVSEQPGWESVVDKEFAEKLKTFLNEYSIK